MFHFAYPARITALAAVGHERIPVARVHRAHKAINTFYFSPTGNDRFERSRESICARSGPAERLQHALAGLRCSGVGFEAFLLLVWSRQNLQQVGEQREVLMLDGGLDGLLQSMIARDECRVGVPHRVGTHTEWEGPPNTRGAPHTPRTPRTL